MAFICVHCKKKKPERERRFVAVDWCRKCCEDELKRTSKGTNKHGVPNLRTEPPGYVLKPR